MKKSHPLRSLTLSASLLLHLGTFCSRSHGAAGGVDISFNPGSGVDGTVHSVAVQPDGKLIIGGRFRTVRGLPRTGIARLNADGSGDPSFDPGTGAYQVYSVALQPDGKLLIGGGFFSVNGVDHPGVARLNSDGSLDTSFDPGTGVTGSSRVVRAVALQSDGKVLIGGEFTRVNGINRGGIALLHSDGSLDTTFDPGPVFYTLNSMAPLADGKVYVAGIAPPLWRLNADGSRDMTFDPDWRSMGEGFSIAVQPDGKVLICKAPQENTSTPNGILRLNIDGTPDSSFQPPTSLDNFVQSVAVQADGKLIIAGYINTGEGTERRGIARLNADGSVDSGFDGLVQTIYPYDPVTVAVQSDGQVIIGGSFLTVNGTVRHRLARLNVDGSLDDTFDPGTGVIGFVSSMVRQPDGKLVAAGRGIDRLNPDGSRDRNFNGEFTPSDARSPLSSVALQTDGRLLLGAGYSGVLRLHGNGSLDGSLQPLQEDLFGSVGQINAVAVQSDGRLLLAGNYSSINGSPRRSVARLHADGTLDGSFLREEIEWDGGTFAAMIVQPDGKVVVGGRYYEINAGTLVGYVHRFLANGDADDTFIRFIGDLHSAVRSLALQPDGKLIVGGSNGDGGFLIRLNSNGTVDAGFDPSAGPNGQVRAIAVQPDGKILIGGDFTSVNAVGRNRIARLNPEGSLDAGFSPGSGADGYVSSILIQPDGAVLIGGDFTSVNGAVRPYVARLIGDSPFPTLTLAHAGGSMILNWPATALNIQLQETSDLALPDSWTPVEQPGISNAGQVSVTIPPAAGYKFFRLKAP